MTTPEGKIKKQIVDDLEAMGAYVFKPVQMGYGKRTVDLLVCWRGQFIGIEVKRPGKTPTPLQVETLDEVRAAGGIAFWVDNREDVRAQLANLERNLI